MTVARQIVAGRTHLMSRRCTQRQLLLRPDEEVEQLYLYCLGESAQRYNVTLHAFVAMSNHQHVIFRDNNANFPLFLAHLNKMISKAMNARLGRWENFWATEQPNAVYLVEPEDRFAKLIYVLANPVADHLVDRVTDWPGATSLGPHLSGRTLTIKRPRHFFRGNGNMPDEVTIRVERLDGFEHLSDAEWTAKIRDALRAEEERSRAERCKNNRSVLGRKAILRAKPTDVPATLERRRSLRPHLACRNLARRIEESRALVRFRSERQAARTRALTGERGVIFPFGTYRVRGLLVSTAPPPAFG